MEKGIGTPENREAAFRVYAFFGGRNVKGILNRLEAMHGFKVSERTLYQWKEEEGWDDRIEMRKGAFTYRERIFLKIMDQMERYERKFAENTSVIDNQASYAYTNLMKAALELSERMWGWELRDPDALRSLIGSNSEESEAGIEKKQ